MVNSTLSMTKLQPANPQVMDSQPPVCRAKMLGPNQRRDIALDVLAGTRSTSEVSRSEGVSRKFVSQQAQIAGQAMQVAFEPVAQLATVAVKDPADRVLFHIPVTGRFIHKPVLALIFYCHSSYRGVLELLRDVFGITISQGNIHNIAQEAAKTAQPINKQVDLSGVRIGAHDEIFQNGKPVLVGCDVKSTYCYLLSLEEHRDAVTWGVGCWNWRIEVGNPKRRLRTAVAV